MTPSSGRRRAPELPGLSAPLGHSTPNGNVARLLLAHINSGELRPGHRLPSERQLAADLGVGRSAVREALAALDLLGIVVVRQGSGSYLNSEISDLLPQTIEWGLMLGQPRVLDLVEARQNLEMITAGLAARKATDADIEELHGRLAGMESAADDLPTFVEADVQFHVEVARIAQNSVLSDILHSIRALLRVWITRAIAADDGHTDHTLAEHRAVYQAIASRDSEAAANAMTEHMSRAAGRLTKSLSDDSAAMTELPGNR